MQGLCMPNFRPLAPLVSEENEVTDIRKEGQNVFTAIYNGISNSSIALIGSNKVIRAFTLTFYSVR